MTSTPGFLTTGNKLTLPGVRLWKYHLSIPKPCASRIAHEEANFRTEVSRIASDFEKGFGTGAEQETVEDVLVL